MPAATFDSQSTLSVERVDGEIVVSYDNHSGRDLQCEVIVSNADVINAYHEWIRSSWPDMTQPPASLQALAEQAQTNGEVGAGLATVPAGTSGALSITWEVSPTSQTFVPAALSICGYPDPQAGDVTYLEIERSVPAGVIGSLDGLMLGSAAASTDLATGSSRAAASTNPCCQPPRR